ncbi:c-type cytochrome [Gallaecimonas pentaromativorans]|uniref:Cytochrome c556 n=1 Tax=Gallaecimonas pentaromativorans TaxID=584787 RepID=A0A3N1PFN2_9GAMM|nr:cytochrome c [Gallaecimonas pentaromativorans]ROQ25817.1 cytochrome c556 [Gallaecimonas pentaromativorans]
MKKLVLATLVLVAPLAQAFDNKDEAIHYRQSVFTLVAAQFGEMGAMVKGEKPFDAKEFQYRAESLAALSKMPLEGFLYPGSDKGGTKAKAAVWQKTDEFKAKLAHFQKDATNLAEAAQSGDLSTIKPAFMATAKNCKACHSEFKNR